MTADGRLGGEALPGGTIITAAFVEFSGELDEWLAAAPRLERTAERARRVAPP